MHKDIHAGSDFAGWRLRRVESRN